MEKLLKKFCIGSSRLKSSSLYGMEVDGDCVKTIDDADYHAIFLCSLDSGKEDCQWGRLVMNAELPKDMAIVIRALASDENRILRDEEIIFTDDFIRSYSGEKLRLFTLSDSTMKAGATDILLYEQRGRYLWICIELIGAGSAKISNINVYVPGDNFFQTFPEVYRTNGEFMHRYLSVFSSLYNDLQEKIDGLPALLDPKTAPPELLVTFANWLGIEMDGDFLSDRQCRELIQLGFGLLSYKGTRGAIEQIISLIVDEPFYILERIGYENGCTYKKEDPFAVTILILRKADEQLHAKLLYLIDQFRPIRTKIDIQFLGDCARIDDHCYLDINAQLVHVRGGSLNEDAALNGLVCLQ